MKKLLFLSFAILFVAKISAQSIQFVHNTDDDSLSNVKLWINDTVWVNNFSFPAATPVWTNLATGVYTIGISALSATSQAQSICQKTINVQANEEHFVTLNGRITLATQITPLVIADYTLGFVATPNATQSTVRFYNGSTISGSIDIVGITYNTPISYTQTYSAGLMTASPHILQLSGNGGYLGEYILPLQNYAEQNINVVINGFDYGVVFKSVETSDDYGIGLYIVEPNGVMAKLTETITIIGIKENVTNKINLSVYPNPASEIINIELEMMKENAELKIIDVLGRTVVQHSTLITNTSAKLDLHELKSGIYFLQVYEKGKTLAVKKVIKE